jgi:hypothetical protein
MRTTWVISTAIAVAAAAFATGAPASAATSPAVTSPATASITASPVTMYAPTSLCPGNSHPTSTVVTGAGFPADTAYTVTYNGKKSTTVTGTTSATGGFTATIGNVDQPDGYYPVKARAGTATAITWVATNGYTCVTGNGTPNALRWKWQGAGFDAGRAVNMLISGSVYYSANTGSNGAFYVTFTAACPGQGNLPISFQAYLQRKQQTISAGTLNCG